MLVTLEYEYISIQSVTEACMPMGVFFRIACFIS